MKTKLNILFITIMLFAILACNEYGEKETLGNPNAFDSSGTGVSLIPSLNTSCGSNTNCISE